MDKSLIHRSVIQLPQPGQDAFTLELLALRLKKLRLLALQVDPTAFTSTYASECQKPLDFWKSRILNPKAKQFVMVQSTLASDAQNFEPNVLENDWIGMLVVLCPDDLDHSSDGMIYQLAGVFVDPPFRKQGVCTLLVQGGLKFIRDDLERRGAQYAVCTAAGFEHNASAIKFYEALGFSSVRKESTREADGSSSNLVTMSQRVEHMAAQGRSRSTLSTP